ncbi:MAG: TIM barrel protein [Candidatus Nanoarchaeia archaeon]|nr:TIM barrel protein [Candidatus Haiyanarchaeum thermophilum]MCW1303186.1 TIM barrel protein [Candidatus Haiyanarchaeum thermophilum]MCW1303852.1 TIM barrel protein [Candidatus Haiyanarchaeum thermophilum]MCW1306532.1 TIM barrel protein [Candidatus Haiyanarchaeum thermophilum]MCW1306945.1 TIM barrel protein [Candidatus Haiyanarchaeum thermophilum]
MIKLGPAGKPLGFEGPFLECLEFLKELRLNAVEVQFVRNIWMKPEQAINFGKLARKLKIALSVHAPYFINLCSQDHEVLEASKQRIIESCRLAELMGASHVVFHPGFYGKLTRQEAYDVVKRALKEISKQIGKVLIAPEVMGNATKFGDEDELIRLSKEVDKVTVTLDFAHIHARYNGKLREKKDYLDLFAKFEKELGREYIRNFHSHFTCVKFDRKGEKAHLPLSAKQPNFEELAKALIEYGINNCTIISESPLLEKDALEMLKILEGYGYKF